MSVPKLRFPGFAGEWEKTQLRQVLKSVDAGWSPSCEERKARPHEWGILKTTAVVWGGYDHTQSKALPSKLSPRAHLEVRADDILVTRAGPIDRVAVVAYVEATRPKLMISDKLMRARVNEAVSPAFVSRTLGTRRAQAFFAARKSGLAEAQANISQAILNATPIYIPFLPEQQKIAAFLGAVDAKLAALAARQAALVRFKAGLMQKLFSQQLRFTRDDGGAFPDWQEKELRAVSIINPKSPKLPERFRYIDLESVNAGTLGAVSEIDATEAPSRAQRVLQRGDILFQMVRPYQRNNLHFDLIGVYVGSTGYAQIRAKQNRHYLFQVLHTDEFVNRVLERCTGTGYPAINSNDLGKVTVPFPHPDEQQKIANALSTMDTKIQAVADQVAKLQTFKKGLLQQMFV